MKIRTVFYCTECGAEAPKWQGRCSACGAWNTMEQQPQKPPRDTKGRERPKQRIHPLDAIDLDEEIRFSTGTGELDRVLGGGAVTGSLVLVGGAPGVGKSTLLLQICGSICKAGGVLYASGEESPRQLKMRAQRLGVEMSGLCVLSETNIDDILEAVAETNPKALVVDSIQTMYREDLAGVPGSVGQVKECTMALMNMAKSRAVTVFVIGHVNKEGAIAGPKVLEHMVDCVLYFEGDRNMSYRVLRAAKNRFGSTNETGIFEMSQAGLTEVPNPSEMLLSERPENVPGTCVACVMEGSRPMLAEVQALVTQTSFGNPRRMASGVDYNRAIFLLAVLEKRAGMFAGNCDAYINVVGGLRFDEPAADLPTALAIASSFRDRPIDGKLAAFGEVGLTGEIRSVSAMEQRLNEVARLGFTRCAVPYRGGNKAAAPKGLEIMPVRNLKEALAAVL